MRYFLIYAISILFLLACKPSSQLTPHEGYIDVKGGKVWYKIVGSGNLTPIVLLHGGPGVPSYYLKPLAELSKNRPVIFIDQLGCGKSSRISDTSLMTVENYVAQLEQIKTALGLKSFYLYGQSWGTMLATDYYLAHPAGVKALILSSPAISIKRWLSDADTLIATLPDSIQLAILENEKTKTYSNPSYVNAVTVYYQHFLARQLPWSADLDSAFAQTGKNVYEYMGGPSEFTMPGPLRLYDRTNRLPELKLPVLFITGEFDEARPTTVNYYKSLVAGAQMVIIPGAGHLTMQDNPKADIKAINDFLNGIEANSN